MPRMRRAPTEPRELSGEILDLTVIRWAHGGEGVAFPEGGDLAGMLVFVPGAVPGDRVRVRLTERRARWARARVLELLAPSADRETPECPVADRCGGCPWMAGSAEVQATSRLAILRGEARKRLGWDEATARDRIALDPTPIPRTGYRRRLRLAYEVRAEGVVLGFRRARSHQLIDIPGCAVSRPLLQAAHAPLRDALARRRPGEAGEVDLVEGREGVAGRIRPAGSPAEPHGLEEVHAGEHELVLQPGVFCQANPWAFGALHRELRALARARGPGRAVELFAGSGALTTALCAEGYEVSAYEVDPASRALFERNTAAWPGRARWQACDLYLYGRPRPEPPAVDLLLLDPPRAGTADVLPWVRVRRPPLAVLVSCDPATAFRDLGALSASGYEVRSVTGYDMFPHTGHQELLAVLARVGP